jgi:polysaccharide biosynthesis protein PslH
MAAGPVRKGSARERNERDAIVKMRILYLSPRNFWPLNTGAHIRDYYLARETARYANVSFFGIRNPDERDNDSANIDHASNLGFERFVLVDRGRSYTIWKLLRGLIGPTPVNLLNYYDPSVARELSRVLEEQTFDVVQMEMVHLFVYLSTILACPSRPLLVCDWHNIESELMDRYGRYTRNWAQKLYARRTARLMKNVERRLLAQCDAHIVVSERDGSRLRTLAPEARVHVVENGVDVARFADGEELAAPTPLGLGQPRRSIVFVGSMDYHANIDGATYFCGKIWPRIRSLDAELRCMIVGSRPGAAVRDLAQAPGVIVTGTVDDVRPYYRGALAAIVPLRIGGGTRLKILEAMAAGIPVVSTSVGAEGLAVNPGVNILIADTPEEMTRALMALNHSHEMWKRLSEAGRELAQTVYDWSVIGSSLHGIHRDLLDQRPNG